MRGCQSTVLPRRPGQVRARATWSSSWPTATARSSAACSGCSSRLFSGQPPAEVLAFDLPHFFAAAGLESNLTTGRRNGLNEMIKRLRSVAAELVEGQPVAGRSGNTFSCADG